MPKAKRILSYFLSLISLFFIFLLLIGTAAAEDNLTDTDISNWEVHTNQTIQEAINGASPGDTIVVNEGTYNENIQINKTNLTLISNGTVVISAFDPNQPSIFIGSSGNYSKINGFTITSSSVAGIYLSHASHCMISGNTISNNYDGIYLDSSLNNIISGNNITNTNGIYLVSSSNNTISGNNITNNYYNGVQLANSPENTLKNNIITDNAYNLDITGNNISDYIQDIDTSNTIYGEPIYYLVGQNGLVYDGISTGYLILVLCNNIQIKNAIITSQVTLMNTTNVVIENCDLSWNEIHLVNSSYNTITEVSTTRISFDSSHDNVISGNNISSGSNGISLINSSNNSITGNTIYIYGGGAARASADMDSTSNFDDFYIGNYYTGIYLESSSNNIIFNNTVNYARVSGIYLYNSPNNTISSNLLLNNYYGLVLYNSPNNNITENEVVNSSFGIYLGNSPRNVLKNNIFTDNGYNLNILGDEISCYIQDIDTSNTINGNPIYYLINENGLTLDGIPIGFLALISCDNIQVRNVNLKGNGIGILLINTTNSSIENNNITDNYEYGIKLWNSLNNTISTNYIANSGSGIYLESSSNNIISENTINIGDYNYVEYLIFLKNSSNNEINENNINGGLSLESSSENNISNNEALKIVLQLSPYNNISTNHASNIYLFSSSNINISHNIISYNSISYDSSTGIYLESSSNCTILNNNITGDAKDTNNNYYTMGILLENSSNNNIISNNNLASYSRGIIIRDSNSNYITTNNLISDLKNFNINYGISFYNAQSYGISTDGTSSNNTISGNTMINNQYGIYFHFASNNIATNNIFDDNYIGIILEESSQNTISNNSISNGTYGILTWPSGSNNNLISENDITNQIFAGIRIKSSSNTIFNNNLSNNSQGYSTGIYLDTSSNNIITGNIISGWNKGIYLSSNSQRNTISGNNQIVNNSYGIHLITGNSNIISGNGLSNNSNGISIESSTNNTISENILSNNTYGLSLTSSNDCEILNNDIQGNSNSGIQINNSSNTLISENIIQNSGTGIKITSSPGTIISNNQITGNNKGIILTSASETVISKNHIAENLDSGIEGNLINSSISENNLVNNGSGIILTSSSNNTLSKNTITHNNNSGISLASSSNDNILENNIAENGDSGIFLGNSANTLISNNFIQNNAIGITLTSSSLSEITFTTITKNNITGNTNSGIKGVLKNSFITENMIQDNGEGINLQSNSSNNLILNNTITGNNNTGVSTGRSSTITISNNMIQNNDIGIILSNSSGINISNNDISENINFGIKTDHTDSLITGNLILNNSIGIDIGFSRAVISKNSIIGNNNVGIKGGLSTNSIKENIIIDNNEGIHLQYLSNSEILNNIITGNNNSGISIGSPSYEYNSLNNTISGNIISDNGGYGVHLYGRYSALRGMNSGNTILNNQITGNNNSGISFDYSRNNLISRNNITNNNGSGIVIYSSFMGWSSGNTITHNNISENNGDGINISSGTGITISNNNITGNNGSGISIRTSNNIIAENVILNNLDSGIALNNASSNKLYSNDISNNKNGISLTGSSGNEINECIILNNIDYDIYMSSSSNNYNIKSTLDENKTFIANSSLISSWDFYVTVLDMVGNPVEDASIVITDQYEVVRGFGTTDANGLFKVDDNSYTLTETAGPYVVHVFYNDGEYLFHNSITQRSPDYLMNSFSCNLPFIDPNHDNLLPDGSGGSGGSGGGSGGSGGSGGGSEDEIKPPRLYIEIPDMSPEAKETAIHYNSVGLQFVYVYNIGSNDTGPVMVYFDIGGIFKIVGILGDGDITLWDESSTEETPVVYLANIAPKHRAVLLVLIEAGDDPDPEEPGDEDTGELKAVAVAIDSAIIYTKLIDQEKFVRAANTDWWESISDVVHDTITNVTPDTIVELYRVGILPFRFGFVLGTAVTAYSMISQVHGVIKIAEDQIMITYQVTTQSGYTESKNVRVWLQWKEDVPQEIKDRVSEFHFDSEEIKGYAQRIHSVRAFDPNEIIGPTGYGEQGFIPYLFNLPYMIKFENLANATAPAQKVIINEYLDSDLDWSTFKFGDVSFSGMTIPVWQDTVDLRPNKNLLVKITKTIDYSTGLVTWIFESIDPDTGLPPIDPLIGFLPPNINSPEGDGWVTYDISPKLNLSSGTEIRAKASIIFDTNEPIETNELLNTIDCQNPVSNVNNLPSETSNLEFEVSWSGNDTNGSGIYNYIIYVSENDGTYTKWLSTSNTSAIFSGEPGYTYKFFSIATDNVENVENAPFTPDAITTINIINNQPPVANAGSNYTGDEGSTITLDASSSSDPDGDVLKYRWDFNNDGIWDTEWLDQPTTTYIWNDNYDGVVKLEVSDGELSNETTAQITINNVAPIVNAGQDQVVDEGETVNFNGSFTDHGINDTHNIKWDFGDGTIVTGTLTTTHRYVDNGIYNVTLTVTDKDNATGTANLTVTVNNVAPIVNAGVNKITTSGEKVELSGSYIDPGILDTFTVKWDFGDSSTPVFGTLNPSHKYYSKGNYTVTLTVIDKDGGVGTNTITITVNPINASVNIYPKTLKLKMCGKWLTAIIKLPKTYDVSKVKANTIKLVYSGINIAACNVIIIKNTIVAIFDASKLTKQLKGKSNPISIIINGKIKYNGGYAEFEGSDIINIKKRFYPWSSKSLKKFYKFFNFGKKYKNFCNGKRH